MPKNIVIFSDGTGQEGGKGPDTNIYKLFKEIEHRTPNQVSFYDRGLGTGWKKITGSVGGSGIQRNILEAYRFIFDNYQSGDKIFLFGFSRGAATVRSLSSFIHHFGILPSSRPELIAKAYRIYRIKNSEKRENEAKSFIAKHHTMWTKIHFLGCYDTVAALGFPIKWMSSILDKLPFTRHSFHNFRLSESVSNAYHALSIDDERLTFHPVLWDYEVKEYQKVKQVWFLGMHTDVGGGYEINDLSNITFRWLKEQAISCGLIIYKKDDEVFELNPNGHMHNSRQKWWERIYRRRIRQWDTSRKDRTILHESVLQRTKNPQNLDSPNYKSWILDLDYEIEK